MESLSVLTSAAVTAYRGATIYLAIELSKWKWVVATCASVADNISVRRVNDPLP